jgi:hypothetical protein
MLFVEHLPYIIKAILIIESAQTHTHTHTFPLLRKTVNNFASIIYMFTLNREEWELLADQKDK